MKEHDWSLRMAVYENIDMIVCKGCGAIILAGDADGNFDKDCQQAELPLDCDAALPFVIHEDYKDWDQGPWDDDELPEWGPWGCVYSVQTSKHVPCALWRVGRMSTEENWLFCEDKFSLYMEAWRRCQELNKR